MTFRGRNRLRLLIASLGAASVLAPLPAQASVSVHWTEADPVVAGTTISTTSTLYKFSTVVAGKAVRWNPCAPIYWRFNPAGAPSGSGLILHRAVARIAQATGTTWKYVGTSTATPSSGWLPKSISTIKPVLIGWTDGAHSNLLAGQPAAVLGVARTAYFGATVGGVQLAATKAAVIALDRTNRLPLTGAVSWRTVILHELAHVMGLDHVANYRQLMNPILSRTHTDYQSGDLAGLSKVGRPAGCINLGF